ncbi:MAG: hypothetical protein UX01_C0001G0174 [Candidatus Collierbacteria bacterium GW2011_GWB2_45_17]|uniref:Uncharacterized protein n=1 Tax=Candidatus Collierbacteria bacterium GW2011_GWB2_45_17 TaxID=1618388 RepID=A0A837IFS1_9BACT|nr:MAG: hypothetical protein UW48_C0001G0170 [Microgenomates group bacterium GW2011_GWC1_44_23]KKT96290.1 MAG: hypothetical protein UW96_C0001G0168 [Candidatus Collierbacteria bacterium GW2011_GWA1_45_15]KKU01330.1 MAG: hypothetical protein UX01_C0001G0174 [Candidatus Collierbacteria bacterium GW2011_GWB2_45_17]
MNEKFVGSAASLALATNRLGINIGIMSVLLATFENRTD